MTPSFGTVRINGADPVFATLHRDQQWETIHSEGPRWDPMWRHVDKAGHPHVYGPKGSTPTLDARREERPCDGTCGGICQGEGYGVTVFTCPRCQEQIEPGVIRGPYTVQIPGPIDWRLDIDGGGGAPVDGVYTPIPGDQTRYRIAFDGPDGSWDGEAVIGDQTCTTGPSGRAKWETVMHGVSVLSEVAHR